MLGVLISDLASLVLHCPRVLTPHCWFLSASVDLHMNSIFFRIEGIGIISSLLRLGIFLVATLWHEVFSKSFIFTWKRIVIVVGLLFILPSLICWNHVGFWLDDIFFPLWRDQTVDKPLFIVGNARSGTTWCHRVLTRDESLFTTLKTWEILFGASVTWRKLFIFLFNVDRKTFRGRVLEMLLRFETQLIGHSSLHPVGLMEAEEDEWIMMHIFLSQLIMLFFPLGGCLLNPLVGFDLEYYNVLPSQARRDMFRYYRDCIKRHMYARFGGSSTSHSIVFVSKNPPFTMRLRTIYETFPDARIICLVRDPIDSIPSMISYISQVWIHLYWGGCVRLDVSEYDLQSFMQLHFFPCDTSVPQFISLYSSTLVLSSFNPRTGRCRLARRCGTCSRRLWSSTHAPKTYSLFVFNTTPSLCVSHEIAICLE